MLSIPLNNHLSFSTAFMERGIYAFDKACQYVQQLPYGRNTDKSNPLVALQEGKGTCSTKHALLKNLADELGIPNIRLFTGIFRMGAQNTPRIADVLTTYRIPYMPEAHCYLKYENTVYDYTFPGVFTPLFLPELIQEIEIIPSQTTDYKVAYHRDFLKDWIQNEQLPYRLDEIWKIREACIQALGQ